MLGNGKRFLRHTGFVGEIWGMLGACFWGALHRIGGSKKCCGHAFGMLGGPWVSLRVPWASLGILGRPGILLGGPWDDFPGLERSLAQSWQIKTLILVSFKWDSKMLCF